MSTLLYDIAHARAGDKGNLNTIAVIAYRPEWYPVLCEQLTPERVAAQLGERITGAVTVHRMDNVDALILVCPRAGEDTVTTSLYLDAHGKSLASVLLGMSVDVPPGMSPCVPSDGAGPEE